MDALYKMKKKDPTRHLVFVCLVYRKVLVHTVTVQERVKGVWIHSAEVRLGTVPKLLTEGGVKETRLPPSSFIFSLGPPL